MTQCSTHHTYLKLFSTHTVASHAHTLNNTYTKLLKYTTLLMSRKHKYKAQHLILKKNKQTNR